jgi:hypothetical protein
MSFFYNKYYRFPTEADIPSVRQPPSQPVDRLRQVSLRAAGKRSYSPKVRDDVDFVPETSRTVAEARMNNAVRRFHTMKQDHNWYTYNDIPRPYNPSDLTGWQKMYRG